jgi:hypothetical protein
MAQRTISLAVYLYIAVLEVNVLNCRMASVLLGLLRLGCGSDEVMAEADKRRLCLN